ncbi:SGNH/GDSL hydrolase family protein [Calothrix sp. 336/3]|uniref:SGNH/GDSL hydrolase family protein n=1 Tax=Calothrix sp. 336/3 TaxID=1337936 RepID=UPI0004E41152|nr:SGNH/GDSL hydrolase family protein [Calothrix sp. 336/3]AKG19947.1 lysophospholipase [Calothrix sp. 336/3]
MRKFRNFYLAFLLATLGGSIFLNFILYEQAKKYYFELNETRLDPVGLNYYPANSQKFTTKQKLRVIFFGDSRAESWKSPNIDKYEFLNRGISSQTSIQSLQRFSSHMGSLKPDIVVIQVGINDLKTIALFPDRRNEIVRNCQASIKEIVEASKKLGAIAIVTTIFPPGEVPLKRQPFWSDEIGKAVKETNAYIATLADEKTIIFDTSPILVNSQGLILQNYQLDELHLKEQGYVALNQELVRLIETIERKKVKS